MRWANGKTPIFQCNAGESIARPHHVSENADVAKEQLAAVYRTAIAASTASIIIKKAASVLQL